MHVFVACQINVLQLKQLTNLCLHLVEITRYQKNS